MELLQSALCHSALLALVRPDALCGARAKLRSPHNSRELLSTLAVLLPAMPLQRIQSVWAVGALALLSEFYRVARAERTSAIQAYFMPLILFRLLAMPLSPADVPWNSPAAEEVLRWVHLAVFQCSTAGISTLLFSSDQSYLYQRRAFFCIGCAAIQFGSHPSIHLVAAVVTGCFDEAGRLMASQLPGVFSNTETGIVISLTFAAITALASLSCSVLSSTLRIEYSLKNEYTLRIVSGGLLTFVLVLSCFLSLLLDSKTARGSSKAAAAIFYAGGLAAGFGLYAPWMQMITQSHPWWWVLDYLSGDSSKCTLLLWWGLVAVLSTLGAHSLAGVSWMPQILVRKVYHVAVVVMFVPGVLVDPGLLFLGYAVALAILLLLEVLRAGRVPLWSVDLNSFLRQFTDERDNGALITTHLYLLLGCALPHWATLLFGSTAAGWNQLSALAGVFVLGVSDSAASAVGKRFGKHQWNGSKKTV